MSKLHIDVDFVYPIGSIYISVVNVNPTSYWGGEWEPFALGRTLVGVDDLQSEFSSSEQTGGEKTHKLTISEIPKHSHKDGTDPSQGIYAPSGQSSAVVYFNENSSASRSTTETGGSQSHNNLQPYITVYMWKRIA